MNKNILIVLIFIFCNQLLFGQPAVGEWREHFSHNKAVSISESEEKIYVGTELAIFTYDKDNGNIEKLSKITGLSDVGISVIKYNKNTESLFIAYENSNIDIIKNNNVYNFSEIKRKHINQSKTINNLIFIDDIAWLACGFGIVLFDTENLEFIDTYYIGEDANLININELAYDGNMIYAASENGIYKADINSNLSDYNNWSKINNIPNYDFEVNSICYSNNKIYFNQIVNQDEGGIMFYGNNDSWNTFYDTPKIVENITENNGKIVCKGQDRIRIYDDTGNLQKTMIYYYFTDSTARMRPNYAYFNDDGTLIIADNYFGLVMINSDEYEHIYPNGPLNNETGKLAIKNGKLVSTTGSIDRNGAGSSRKACFNIFSNNTWSSYRSTESDAYNFYSIYIDNENLSHMYISAWGKGVYEFDSENMINNYNTQNSTLQTIVPGNNIRIGGLARDRYKNLWVSNYLVPMPISVLTANDEWYSFNFNGLISKERVKDIIITKNNHKWVELFTNGIFAFDENDTFDNTDDDLYRKFYPRTADGEEAVQEVNVIEEDKDGDIWVGTAEGIFVYYNPGDVFDDGDFFADRIRLTAGGSDTSIQYLLKTEAVTSIAVDGANRKWIGTNNSGIFLVSENGKDETHAFNAENSHLPSNNIIDIKINNKSGEVFISTEQGIVSYRSDATLAGNEFGNVYVFPNPVRPNFTGPVTITGLANNVNVKITDISGNIVFETDALGGQAIWYGKTLSGRKVNTGVYLVFCTNKDGTITNVTKLLFIN